ncbi:hypothetical protein [Nitrosopumilus sp. b2]|nr:hypothetical protein [Nitrosopumilus sp. b2]KAF6244711.1 hypothetical protein C6989_07545 [Nitrosopumilus sp. b2]
MLQWKDDYRISSLEDYRNDSMCDKWFPPMSLDAANSSFNCKEAVKNEIPTDWKYNCYDEPMGNPLRDISLSKSDDPQRLQFILEHCEKHGPLDYVGELRYLNDTHLIDLDTCKWDTRSNSGISLDRTVYTVPFSGEKSEQAKVLCEDEHVLVYGICVPKPKPSDFRDLQTGETISNPEVIVVIQSLGAILIILFIVIYAIRKRRK